MRQPLRPAVRLGPAALLVAAVLLTGCGSSSTAGPAAGGAVAASDGAFVDGRTVAVVLPSGRLSVTVSAPADGLAATDTADGHTLDAAEGTRLVGVRWALAPADFSAFSSGADYHPSDLVGPARDVTLTLLTSAGRVPVPAGSAGTSGTAGTVWVSVATDAEPSALEVGYDGVTQRVDLGTGDVDRGRAAALYRPPAPERYGGCRVERRDLTSCVLQVSFGAPYANGPGWAAPGSSYAVVALSVGDRLDPTLADFRMAGHRAVAEVATTGRHYAVFPVPDDLATVRLTARYDGARVLGSVRRPETVS